MRQKKAISLLFAISLVLASLTSAKEISLYEQPNTNAKIIGNIDTSAGIIPIFTSKDGAWVKAGDPRNGNVGWIKSADVNEGAISFTPKISQDGKTTSYQIQYGKPSTLSKEQIEKLQVQQQAAQQNMQKAIQDMMNSINELMKINNKSSVVMPVFIMPGAQPPRAQPNQPNTQPMPQNSPSGPANGKTY